MQQRAVGGLDEYPGISRNIQEYSEISWNIQEYSGISWNIQEYSNICASLARAGASRIPGSSLDPRLDPRP